MPKREPSTDTFTYRQGNATITVTYTCDDGTIVPGPHPLARVEERKSAISLSAHSIDKLDAAMRVYGGGHTLTDDAKAFLTDLLARVICPTT
jgi:hypothetical protein